VRSIAGLEAARNLAGLHLDSNSFTNFALPSGLTNLVTLDLSFNRLTNFALASGFPKMEALDLFNGHLTSVFHLPAAPLTAQDLLALTNLDALASATDSMGP
jgi:Leucine-rich repeat (LRR) protein